MKNIPTSPIGRLRAWWRARRGLRELRKLDTEDRMALYWEAEKQLAVGLEAARFGDRTHARKIWDAQRAAAPDAVLRIPAAADLLLEIDALDEAEALLAEARTRTRITSTQAQQWARTADRRGDRAAAAQRWAEARQRFPAAPGVFSGGAASLAAAGRLEEAESVLGRATRRFPEDPLCHIEYARLAARRGDWEAALKRWTVVRDELHHDTGIAGVAEALRGLGRLDEADQQLAQAQARLPLDVGIAIELARIAEQRGDPTEAAQRWDNARRRFPKFVGILRDEVRVLCAADRHDAAEALLAEGIDQFRDEPDLLTQFAGLGERRGDWAEAGRRWALLRARFPQRPDGYHRGAAAEAAAGHAEAAAALRDAWETRQAAADTG